MATFYTSFAYIKMYFSYVSCRYKVHSVRGSYNRLSHNTFLHLTTQLSINDHGHVKVTWYTLCCYLPSFLGNHPHLCVIPIYDKVGEMLVWYFSFNFFNSLYSYFNSSIFYFFVFVTTPLTLHFVAQYIMFTLFNNFYTEEYCYYSNTFDC